MADQIISLTIPEGKVQTALQGFLKIYPNNEKVLDENGEPTEENKYTNAEWVREKVRQLIVRDVRRGLQMIATDAAQVALDNDMVE